LTLRVFISRSARARDLPADTNGRPLIERSWASEARLMLKPTDWSSIIPCARRSSGTSAIPLLTASASSATWICLPSSSK
jgi:hypothetical protein